MKNLIVVDTNTGEKIEEIEFSGGYNISYTNLTDSGKIRNIRKLNNSKFGEKHWIKNYIYKSISIKLVEKFKELKHVRPNKILFIEDIYWQKPDSIKPKKHWMARIKKANKQLESMLGYEYILETRSYYTEMMQKEQLIALIYHELRHIDEYGDIKEHDVEDWDNMIATLGKDWATTKAQIPNLIDDYIDWNSLEKRAKQMNLFRDIRAVK
ncbi:putative metallopeptidase [Senegalia massiliensis]|uniref:Putative phage metallopeptidase domain-containing protein n=1 Tax=Senegalia massiliensis TaxID=1720316 RepID=A0A845R112_9CLOT|nr:putative metallopeptidase [Senegalia massiliensis]NBI08261.1 hypothetical protein [Senegalia massiliensis]